MSVKPGRLYVIKAKIREFCLNPSNYNVSAFLLDADMMTHYDWAENISVITITAGRPATAPYQILADWSITDEKKRN